MLELASFRIPDPDAPVVTYSREILFITRIFAHVLHLNYTAVHDKRFAPAMFTV